MKHFLGLFVALIALLALAGCSDTGGGGKLNVTLNEWSIKLGAVSLPEGPIEFSIQNSGKQQHEIVILRTDLAPNQLPTKNDGSVDTGAADVHEERTIDEIDSGDTTSRTYSLDPGNYVFIDNTVKDIDGAKTSFYAQGMSAAFTVTKKGESVSPTSSGTASSSATPTPTHS